MAETFYLYILKSDSNKLYIGQTNNLLHRQNYHNWGVAAKFTAQNKGSFGIVYTEEFQTRKEAMKREAQLKKWSRAKKEALIAGNLEKLKLL